jgi:hypothetical protein
MRGLSSLERVVLETIGLQGLSYDEVQSQSGLQENVCFNILQALVIRGLLRVEAGKYRIGQNIPPLVMEEINGVEARKAEWLEMIEAVIDQKENKVFRFQRVAMDSRDEKIFMAMLSNLESFLKDAHNKSQSSIPVKQRKVIFWGLGQVDRLLNQVLGN